MNDTQKSSSNQSDLSRKVCVIVGGTGLIGSEVSRQCAALGGTAIIVAREEERGEALVQEIKENGGEAAFEQCDVTEYTAVVKLVERISDRYGRIDGLVVATHFGTGKPGLSPLEVEEKDFLEYLGRNVGSPFFIAREFIKKMSAQRSGSVVFISSIYGVAAPKFEIYEGTNQTVRAEYAAAKAALIQLTVFLAKFAAPFGVRVNAVSPGAVKNTQTASVVEAYEKQVPLGKRMATPEDISGALTFLLSDASSYITGQNIVIDGGWTL